MLGDLNHKKNVINKIVYNQKLSTLIKNKTYSIYYFIEGSIRDPTEEGVAIDKIEFTRLTESNSGQVEVRTLGRQDSSGDVDIKVFNGCVSKLPG